MNLFEKMNRGEKVLIGMVHCLPLPGSFGSKYTLEQVVERAVTDACTLESIGLDALIVENEDKVLAPTMSKVQFAGISAVAASVRNAVTIPIGLCLGCMNYEESLAVAKAIGADFVRLPIYVDTVMNYNGIHEPCSYKAINYRQMIGANDVKILADVQVKYYHMVNPNISIAQSANWAQSQGADAVIVTGISSGAETSMNDLELVKKSVSIPVVVGSGVTARNIREQTRWADAAIVGTSLRVDGKMCNPIDVQKAKELVQTLRN